MASIRKRTYTNRAGKTVTYYQVRGTGIETKSFPLKGDAEKYAKDEDRQERLGPLHEAEPETFGESLAALFDAKASTVWKENTRRTNEETRKHLAPLLQVRTASVGVKRTQAIVNPLADAGKRRTAQKAHALIISTLRHAASRGQRVDTRVYGMDKVAREGREGIALTLDQLDHLGACMVPTFLAALPPIAGITGMRQAELLGLTEDRVDLAGGFLWIPSGKTRTARRRVYLAPQVVDLLREHLDGLPTWPGSGPRYVFPTKTGKRWDGRRFMGKVWRPAVEWAAKEDPALAPVNFHDLRHTAISLMASSGEMGVELIASQVGHADGGALLLRTYRHLFPGELGRAVDRFGQFLGPWRNGDGAEPEAEEGAAA